MRIIALFVVLQFDGLLSSEVSASKESEIQQREKDVQEAFKGAYIDRSGELKEFFEQTFHGKPSEIADRFKGAWEGASEGVKQFVFETYQNISEVMESENSIHASLSSSEMHEKINNHVPHKESESDAEPQKDVLDSAWEYFKSVFGVDPRDEKSTPAASLPSSPASTTTSKSGVMFGLLTIAAALFLLYQTTVSHKSVLDPSSSAKRISRPHEVPMGYVRLT